MKGEIKANAINEIKQILKRIDMSTEELAKEFLTRKGYYVGNLWSIDDVHYECVPFEAMGILDKVLQDEWLVENTFEMIGDFAEKYNLKRKED
jgi:hypothetical protein